jgi:hypothetical protein
VTPEEYAAMWKLVNEFVDATVDGPEVKDGSKGRISTPDVAPAPQTLPTD